MDKNCPNCGAPITGSKCEYCGTMFAMPEQDTVKLYADDKMFFEIKMNELRSDLVRQQINASIASQQAALLSSIASCNNYIFGGK